MLSLMVSSKKGEVLEEVGVWFLALGEIWECWR